MSIYWVAIIEKPSKKQEEDGQTANMVLAPTPVLAKNENDAAVKVVLDQKNIEGNKDRWEIIVRPF
jgi:hypothetical protein